MIQGRVKKENDIEKEKNTKERVKEKETKVKGGKCRKKKSGVINKEQMGDAEEKSDKKNR